MKEIYVTSLRQGVKPLSNPVTPLLINSNGFHCIQHLQPKSFVCGHMALTYKCTDSLLSLECEYHEKKEKFSVSSPVCSQDLE